MKLIQILSLIFTWLLFSAPAFAADASTCMGCHDSDEFAGMSAADIVADAKDPGIPPHQRFADLSDADLQAIAEELAGG